MPLTLDAEHKEVIIKVNQGNTLLSVYMVPEDITQADWAGKELVDLSFIATILAFLVPCAC